MQADYKPFIDRLIDKYEGGYGWDKGDPGGPTKFGITCYDLAEHRGQRMSSMVEWAPRVHDMGRSEAEDIYAAKYAMALRFSDLRAGVDCCMLDYGVNSGIGRPIRVARALLGAGTGSRLTDTLVQAINEKDPAWFVNSMCQERLHFLKGLRTWGRFGRGWEARVKDLEQYCTALIAGVHWAQEPVVPSVPKGVHPYPDIVKTSAGTVGTTAAAGAAVHTAGLPPWAILSVLGVGVAGGVALVLWQQRQAAKANVAVVLPPTIRPHS